MCAAKAAANFLKSGSSSAVHPCLTCWWRPLPYRRSPPPKYGACVNTHSACCSSNDAPNHTRRVLLRSPLGMLGIAALGGLGSLGSGESAHAQGLTRE